MSKKKASKKKETPEPRSPQPSTLSPGTAAHEPTDRRSGIRRPGIQSGDLQGLSGEQDIDFESVEELAAEGQAREAELLSGVGDAPDPDQGEVRTRQVRADDVPREYLDEK